MIKTYVLKSEPVQAIQWTGDNLEEIRSFIGYEHLNPRVCDISRLLDGTLELIIDTSTARYDSWLLCEQYGYIVKLADGSISSRTCHDFEQNFEELS